MPVLPTGRTERCLSSGRRSRRSALPEPNPRMRMLCPRGFSSARDYPPAVCPTRRGRSTGPRGAARGSAVGRLVAGRLLPPAHEGARDADEPAQDERHAQRGAVEQLEDAVPGDGRGEPVRSPSTARTTATANGRRRTADEALPLECFLMPRLTRSPIAAWPRIAIGRIPVTAFGGGLAAEGHSGRMESRKIPALGESGRPDFEPATSSRPGLSDEWRRVASRGGKRPISRRLVLQL